VRQGARDYVVKPVKEDDLIERVEWPAGECLNRSARAEQDRSMREPRPVVIDQGSTPTVQNAEDR
jgi:hypothetical protein